MAGKAAIVAPPPPGKGPGAGAGAAMAVTLCCRPGRSPGASAPGDHVGDDPGGDRHEQEVTGIAAAPMVAPRRLAQAVVAVLVDDVGRRIAGVAVMAAARPRRRSAIAPRVVHDQRPRHIDNAGITTVMAAVVPAGMAAVAAVVPVIAARAAVAAPVTLDMATVVSAIVAAAMVVAGLGGQCEREGHRQGGGGECKAAGGHHGAGSRRWTGPTIARSG